MENKKNEGVAKIKPRKSTNRAKKGGMSKVLKIVLAFVGVLVLLCGCCVGSVLVLSTLSSSESFYDEDLGESYVYKTVYGDEESDNLLLSIKVDGIILNEEPEVSDIFGSSGDVVYGYKIKEQLIRASRNKKIKGVVMEVSSPGGTVTGSKAIADGIEYYKEETDNPVITYGQGLVASGAYWVSVVTDEIIVDYGSSIGSIGVIFGPFSYYDNVIAMDGGIFQGGVVTQDGIEQYYITAGKYKDSGNPYRKLTEEEINTYQTDVNNNYDDFVKVISDNRGVSTEHVKKDIKALIYGNEQALGLELIDSTGTKQDSYKSLAETTELGSDYRVVREQSDLGFLNSLMYASKVGSYIRIKYLSDNADDSLDNWFSGQVLAYYPAKGF
jgi:protease IV